MMQPKYSVLECGGKSWRVHGTGQLETLWKELDATGFGEDEFIPYWAEIWPSAVALGNVLAENRERIRGRLLLDLGCGLGLTTLVAAGCGARVIGCDYAEKALAHLRQSLRENHVHALLVCMDWRDSCFGGMRFPFLAASDILYERRQAPAVDRFLRRHLTAQGVAWVAEPRRATADAAWSLLESRGWGVSLVGTQTVVKDGTPVTVHVRRIEQS